MTWAEIEEFSVDSTKGVDYSVGCLALARSGDKSKRHISGGSVPWWATT
jgi:hypothetical protein